MNTRVLCVSVVVFTILVFGANHYLAQQTDALTGCPECECKISASQVPVAKLGDKEPSCSVGFLRFRPARDPEYLDLKQIRQVLPLNKVATFSECTVSIVCDRGREAYLDCGVDTRTISSAQTCWMTCKSHLGEGYISTGCGSWVRGKRDPNRKGSNLQPDNLKAWFLNSANSNSSIGAFLPANYFVNAVQAEKSKNTITGSNRWRLIDGEAGLDEAVFTVTTGEVEVQSYCTGDTFRLIGPSVVSLPLCQVDVAGRWAGAFARRLADGKLAPLPVRLELQRAAGVVLKGQLKTPDGVFNIASASQSDTGIYIEATGTVAGKERKFYLNGKLSKGDMILSGSESPAGENSIKLAGFLERLYVADNVLPAAALNQPFSFRLTALSPDSRTVTFRLATPATATATKATTSTTATTSTQREINWFTQANSLGGRPGDQFTLACPANGSLSGFLAGTDVYKDDSSICKAAAHAGLITRQAGGVVSIQLKPDAGAYLASSRNGVTSDRSGAWKGSFVFVSGEAQGNEREREPEPKREPESGRLPKGLSFDASSGTFSGTPTELGIFHLSVIADDGAGNVFEQAFTLTVKRMVLTTSLLPDAFFGQAYSATLQATGGTPPYRFSGIPPKGLTLDPNTGVISGTPTTSRSNPSQFTIRDSQNNSEVQDVLLTVRRTTILTSHFLAEGAPGAPYRTSFEVVGNNIPTKWSVTSGFDIALIGLTLNPDTGELSGDQDGKFYAFRKSDYSRRRLPESRIYIAYQGECESEISRRHFVTTVGRH